MESWNLVEEIGCIVGTFILKVRLDVVIDCCYRYKKERRNLVIEGG
jgi:hypothetical protein